MSYISLTFEIFDLLTCWNLSPKRCAWTIQFEENFAGGVEDRFVRTTREVANFSPGMQIILLDSIRYIGIAVLGSLIG